MPRIARSAFPVLAAMLVVPATANAAVVQLRPVAHESSAELRVIALPGETNLLIVGRRADGTVTVTDTGAPLYPGEHCAGGGSVVTCAPEVPGVRLGLSVATSDGDDHISLEAAYDHSYVVAGRGNDVIVGGAGDDQLIGGAGNDDISGGAGADGLSGSEGADALAGGPGVDTVDYGGRSVPVSVTIDDRADDGSTGERDNVRTDVENLVGGAAADHLRGSDARNRITGGEGADDIAGGGGDDVLLLFSRRGGRLDGGPGRDKLAPGEGTAVDVRDGEPDTVRCSYLKRPPVADPIDVLKRCMPLAHVSGTAAPVTPSGRVQLRLRCRAIGQPCRLNVELRRHGRTLAAEALTVQAPRATIALRLSAHGRRLIARDRTLRVRKRVQMFRVEAPASSTRFFSEPFVLRRGT